MDQWPTSIRAINKLPKSEKETIYSELIPQWVFDDFQIDRSTFSREGHRVVHFMHTPGTRALEITVKRHAVDRDPIMYLNMADTFNNQLIVLLLIVNDPEAKRHNIDIDEHGHPTSFGTSSRNIPAELEAMNAGLAPGQIRKGLRAFKRSVPLFEEFVSKMGHDLFLIEPLTYHNAIVFERYGFNYIRGFKDMKEIDAGFDVDGWLRQRLNEYNPFRPLDAWKSIRKRSWAIHDGILGHPFTGFQMYKRIGHMGQVNTFPDAIW